MKEKRIILLAEDDTFVSDIYHTKLTKEGFEVLLAQDGRAAVELLKGDKKPDIILLDIMMPYMDGLEVLTEIKKNDAWKDIPVIMLTNLAEREQLDTVAELGAKDFLIKSHFTPEEVLSKIEALIGTDTEKPKE